MSARVLSMMATTSARSAGGTANLSSVCATSSMNASHSPGVMRRCRCELSMSLPVYFCGPPAAQHSISVTRYLARQAEVAASGVTPLEVMLDNMRSAYHRALELEKQLNDL